MKRAAFAALFMPLQRGWRAVDQVADQREDPQPDRYGDEHGMNRVLGDVCECTHKTSNDNNALQPYSLPRRPGPVRYGRAAVGLRIARERLAGRAAEVFPARSDRQGSGAGLYRQLHGMPHRRRRKALCRRHAAEDAFRHDPRHQHHAGPADRHRPLAARSVHARHARGRGSRGPQSLPSLSLRPFHEGDGRRHCSAVCLRDDARAGEPEEPRQFGAAAAGECQPLEIALSGAWCLQARPGEEPGVEPRRVSRRRPRPLRRLPHAAQQARRGKEGRSLCGRRSRGLACPGARFDLAVAGSVDGRGDADLSQARRRRPARAERGTDGDVRAIATYVVSLDTRNADQRKRAADAALARARAALAQKGNAVYDGACADCHNLGRAQEGGALELPLGTALTIPTPRNLAYIVRDGILPREGERGGWMPAFAGALTDEQLTDLLIYLRALSGQPAWADVAGDVRKTSKGKR